MNFFMKKKSERSKALKNDFGVQIIVHKPNQGFGSRSSSGATSYEVKARNPERHRRFVEAMKSVMKSNE